MKLLIILLLALAAIHTHAQVDRPAVISIDKVIAGALAIKDSNERKVIYTKLDSMKILAIQLDSIYAKRGRETPRSLGFTRWNDSAKAFINKNIGILSRIKTDNK